MFCRRQKPLTILTETGFSCQ